MKPVHIGVPVLRRYDLLQRMLLSAAEGTVVPAEAWVVDNGKQPAKMAEIVASVPFKVSVFEPDVPMGVAEAWSWLIDRLPEERIITNDDISFVEDSLETMRATAGDLVFGHGYSCYLFRDSAKTKIGLFDEAISPGYAYWEDIDYDTRVRQFVAAGGDFVQQNAPCTVLHGGSQTNRWATHAEVQEHHRKFGVAKDNMIKKYGHLPYEQQHPALQPHLKKKVTA